MTSRLHDANTRVAIIGSGFSGLAAAIALKKQGIENFVIFEQESGLGGTWWNNRYPGAEVDLESHIYSFSFERYDWSRTHAGWREIQQYLNHVATKWGLDDRILFEERVESVTWSDAKKVYAVATSSQRDHGSFQAVISAVGFLNIPVLPPFARGETEFEGIECHSSRWPDGLEMAGKRVGILGTGSSAVQVITEAARDAEAVKIFQIEPNWLLPKHARDFSAAERRRFRNPLVYLWKRYRLYVDYDTRQYRSSHARKNGRVHRKRGQLSRDFLKASLGDRPDLMELATPAFDFEARRTVVSDTYYESLKSENVTLIPHGVKGLVPSGAIDANGDEHELDLIVYATGFDAANYLGGFKVTGKNGVDLHETWAGEPEATLGIMVPEFPNFFMMYGPNTNSIPLVTFYETQAKFAATLIDTMGRKGKATIGVSASTNRRYNEWLQKRLARTVWATTNNYFQAGSGKIVSQWPFSATAYIIATKLARRFAVKVK